MTESSDPKERQHEACMMCCKVLFAIILPPIAVLLEKGCGCELCLNIVLTLLGWIPGMLMQSLCRRGILANRPPICRDAPRLLCHLGWEGV